VAAKPGSPGITWNQRRGDRLLALAKLPAQFAKGEPGGSKPRGERGRLFEQVGGTGKIPLQMQVARELEAAVGIRIAGGEK
jgi:hypothetical protein